MDCCCVCDRVYMCECRVRAQEPLLHFLGEACGLAACDRARGMWSCYILSLVPGTRTPVSHLFNGLPPVNYTESQKYRLRASASLADVRVERLAHVLWRLAEVHAVR